LITALQVAKNKKDGSGALPLEITNQFEEFVLQIPEDNKKKSRDLGY
jgi:predicted neutral ceramidase superfamily lipid hydrolase